MIECWEKDAGRGNCLKNQQLQNGLAFCFLKGCNDGVVVGDVGFYAFVRQGFEVLVEQYVVDTEGGEIAVVGGAEAVTFLAESVGVVAYQPAVGVGGGRVVEIAAKH